jgi:hypothetical protein
MKKTLLIAAAALISASALGQTVTSANIVGYVKKDAVAGNFQIIAPQFFSITNGVALSNAFSDVTDLSEAYAFDGGYQTYTYFGGDWFDGSGLNANGVMLNPGASVWFKSSATTNVMMSGEVPSADSITVTVPSGFSLQSNPYPIETALSDLPVATDLTELYIFDGGYQTYTYFGGAWFDGSGLNADAVTIEVGQGFWINNPGAAFDLTYNKQY